VTFLYKNKLQYTANDAVVKHSYIRKAATIADVECLYTRYAITTGVNFLIKVGANTASTKHEHITGVWGTAPSGVQRHRPQSEVQSPPLS